MDYFDKVLGTPLLVIFIVLGITFIVTFNDYKSTKKMCIGNVMMYNKLSWNIKGIKRYEPILDNKGKCIPCVEIRRQMHGVYDIPNGYYDRWYFSKHMCYQ